MVHCTGYIKNWPPQGIQLDQRQEEELAGSSCCLVAIGRLQVTSMPNSNDLAGPENTAEFVTRHTTEGKFTFSDQRVINLMGYRPQELLGKSCFDFIHTEDQSHMKDFFEQVVKMKGQVMNSSYRFRAKNSEWVWLKTNAFAFINPYTDDIEYIVCTNSTAKSGASTAGASSMSATATADVGAAASTVTAAAAAVTPVSTDYRQTPSSGLDYSLPSGAASAAAAAARGDMYSSHLSQPSSVGAPTAQPAQVYSYDQTSSPVGAYGSPGGASSTGGLPAATGVPHGRASVGKNSGTPTPPQSAWSQPPSVSQSAPVAPDPSSSYHYSNLSPNRSPGLYRGTPAAPSHTAAAPHSMWHWQGNGQATGLELGHPQATALPPHQTELGDMLHMLGHHGGAAAAAAHHHTAAAATAHHGFENLGGMFTGQYQ